MKFDVIYSGVWYDDCHPFNALAKDVDVAKTPDELKESNAALVIWGGSDIHPEYYGHPMHRTTYPGGQRDRVEWGLMQRAIEKQIPIIGVCRGGQMLTAAAGGWLIQDVRGHAGHGGHTVTTKDGKTFMVNSIHHQMMCGLEKVDHELVAWSTERRSEKVAKQLDKEVAYGYMDDKAWSPPEGWVEPEFIYFPKINGYAIQWHPEMMPSSCEATRYILAYIERKESERGSNQQSILDSSCAC